MVKDFYYEQFCSEQGMKELGSIKRWNAVKVSVGLPVLNEEKTLGHVIQEVRTLQDAGLVDEIMVFDSGSTDRSHEIAKAHNIPFITDSYAASELGVDLKRGKGFNLWASLHYLQGDIVVWMDTDLPSPDKRFILANIGPLIMDHDLVFVKGRYSRPETDNRVTRYVAEPLLSMMFPALNSFIDPLCGQYAGRREHLKEMPWDSGYGTEVSILINMVEQHGIDKVAQSYMGTLENRIRDTPYYGVMSAEIVFAILKNAKRYGVIDYNGKMARTLVQQIPKDEVNFEAVEYQIAKEDLPPMKEVEARLEERAMNTDSRSAQSTASIMPLQ